MGWNPFKDSWSDNPVSAILDPTGATGNTVGAGIDTLQGAAEPLIGKDASDMALAASIGGIAGTTELDALTDGQFTDSLGINNSVYDQTQSIVSGVEDAIHAPEDAANKATQMAELAAQQGIDTLTGQQKQIEDLYGSYYESGQEGISGLENMMFGDGSDYKPSKLFEYQSELGERGIRRRMAAKGKLSSSGSEMAVAGQKTGLREADIERHYQKRLGQIQVGQGAADRITAGSMATAGGVGSLYQSLGSRQQQIMQGFGETRSALYQTGGNMLQNLGQYMGSRQ